MQRKVVHELHKKRTIAPREMAYCFIREWKWKFAIIKEKFDLKEKNYIKPKPINIGSSTNTIRGFVILLLRSYSQCSEQKKYIYILLSKIILEVSRAIEMHGALSVFFNFFSNKI